MSGQGYFVFKNLIDGVEKKLLFNSEKETIIETIPGWAHNIKNTGKKDLIAILWANENFNKEN